MPRWVELRQILAIQEQRLATEVLIPGSLTAVNHVGRTTLLSCLVSS
ncbi:MAG TPA: hypothetical protein VHP35_11000 [Terriglobia bacterium]|nr:hypothetical protein [Terriglobia bacterium]